MGKSISLLKAKAYDTSRLLAEIKEHPEIWNTHKLRTDAYVHSQVSDIWVRYNAWGNYGGDAAKFNAAHWSVWYPVVYKIPSVVQIVRQVVDDVGGSRLGGVLITKIPPGGKVEPHIDSGWHASYYDKYAVQLEGNDQQAFCFEDSQLSPHPGDLYTFDNSKLHWVTNDSGEDRMTLIICIKQGEH